MELCLTAEIEEILIKAVVEPDRHPEKLIRFSRERGVHAIRMRHHSPERRTIMRLVWKARLALLEGRNGDAVWCLGKALHYVQDLSVDPGWFHSYHDERENAIARLKAMELPIHQGAELAISSPRFVEKCLRSLRPRSRPAAAFHQATLYSSAIAAAVLDEDPLPASEQRRILNALRRHRYLTLPAAVFVTMSLMAVSALNSMPWLAIPGLLSGVLIWWSDRPYHRLKQEARWHGLA